MAIGQHLCLYCHYFYLQTLTLSCKDTTCSDYNYQIGLENLYDNITKFLISAAEIFVMKPQSQHYRSTHIVPGWKTYVKDSHNAARDASTSGRNMEVQKMDE